MTSREGVPVRDVVVELDSGARTTLRIYSAATPATYAATLILAHGAGTNHFHPFLTNLARGLSGRGIHVATFNFLYMEQRKRVPDRMPQLVRCFRAAIDAMRNLEPATREHLFIGGKSMGGRAATHVAVEDPELPLDGLVLLGYPLHPPGKPDQRRDAHLPNVGRPMLFVQGSRDPFGTPSELKPILASLTPMPTLHHVEGGDHSFKLSEQIETTIFEWIGAQISHRVP